MHKDFDMKINDPIENPHHFTVEEMLQTLQTDAELGLSSQEAAKRNQAFGYNIYQNQKQKSLLMMMILQFKSPIVYLLIIATAVTLYFKDYIEALSIFIVILINALIGFLMELQARRSMDALKEMDVVHAKVIRDGKLQEIPSAKITLGDIIFLEAGDLIPADAHVITSNQLQCDESSLSGESFPITKNTKKLKPETILSEQFNMVFKGTSVVNGNGKAVITGISKNTELGTIRALVEQSEQTETPLEKKIRLLSRKLIWITLLMTSVFAISGFVKGENWVMILKTSIALAVAAFPEGLPIVSTVALAYGMLIMAKRNAIIKNLSAVETLGSTNIILTDKTGTLTENKIYIDTISFPEAMFKVRFKNNRLDIEEGAIEKNKVGFQKLRLIGVLCNNAVLKEINEQEKLMGDPIEIALIHLAESSGYSAKTLKESYERIAEQPFNSDLKMMATLHQSADGYFVAAKGSAEYLLKKCTQQTLGNHIQKLDDAAQKKILADAEKMAADGLRVLAFAYQSETELDKNDYLHHLIYVGMIGFLDPPRSDVKEAILSCKSAGIKVVMITGDHPLTALNIAKKVGLVDETELNTLTGSDLPDMNSLSVEWKNKILSTAIFARTTPKQKLEIVNTYQMAGNIVAMTGDGVNDAPALKKADIGIAMGLRGTQVAKESASMVLKDNSFTSIARAILHGRVIFLNIQKFVIYLVSCNLSEIFVVTALGFIAPAATLLPLQILFLNMVTDVFPALALGLGKGDGTVMEKPPRDPKHLIVSNKDWITITLYAFAMTFAVIVAVIYSAYYRGFDAKTTNNIAFITLAFAQLFHVFNMSSAPKNVLINDVTKNTFIWFAIFICSGLMMVVYLSPKMRLVLGLAQLPAKVWLIAIFAGLIPLVLIQIWKWLKN